MPSVVSREQSPLIDKRAPTYYNVDTKGKEKVHSGESKSMFSFLAESDFKALFYISCLAFVVRLAFLHHPSVVIFDEVHFGGFAQKYMTGQFFLDLHPPLARLLVTLSAWVGGFDGKFTFYNIGADYIRPNVPYITMRAFTATLGALVAPIAFVTMRGMGLTVETASAISTMIVFGTLVYCDLLDLHLTRKCTDYTVSPDLAGLLPGLLHGPDYDVLGPLQAHGQPAFHYRVEGFFVGDGREHGVGG